MQMQMQSKEDQEDIDIMSYINKDKLNLINDAFNKLNMGLTLEQFLKIMLHYSDISSETEQVLYVEKLVDAFKQIDVNGDETLEWDEFSNYIVETGTSKQKKNFVNVIRNYHLSAETKDKLKHDSEISKVFFFPQIKHLLALEHSSKKIIVYNYSTGAKIKSFEGHSGSVVAAEYISSQGFVVTSGSDNCLMFWDPNRDYQFVNKIPTREIQLVLKWYNNQKYLITGGFDQMVNVYKNLEFEDSGKLKHAVDLHSLKRLSFDMITDIIVLEKQKIIAASDFTGYISLWYLHNFEKKDKLMDAEYGHHRAVVSLAAIEEKNWLLSCGFEHFVMVWDLVVGKHIAVLQGHSQSLIGVKIFPGTTQIITGDVSGIFKIWDSRDLSLVQTFSIPASINKRANSFCVTIPQKKRIIVGADKVYFFEYEESQETNLADSKTCLCVFYNEVFNTFVTAHLDSIKIWDAQNGQLKQVFRDITDNEISCVKFDERKRKLFIGDVEGRVLLINILNGVQMKYFTKHREYVSAMAYYSDGKKFISASWDGFIKIHDDNSAEEKGLQLFELNHSTPNHINSCNSIDFSEEMKILASGFDNGDVTLINMKTLSSEGNLQYHKKVLLVSFLDIYPSIVVCDQDGTIHFWSLVLTKPKKVQKDFELLNISANENNKKECFPVKCLCYEKSSRILLVGDETGYVKALDIKDYIDYLLIIRNCDKIDYSDLSELKGADMSLTDDLAQTKEILLTRIKTEQPCKNSSCDIVISLGDLMKIRESINPKKKACWVKEWKAHKHGVTSVCCHSDPVFYVTAGQDLKVHIWNEDFNKIGSLITSTDSEWNVKINIEEERKRAREEAIVLQKNLKEKTFESLFEGETKIHNLTGDNSISNDGK